jgi:uncharacterized cupredoxin-like copper-binding protein
MLSSQSFSPNKHSLYGTDITRARYCALVLSLFACLALAGCGSAISLNGEDSMPTISSFAATGPTIASGASSVLSWSTAGAASVSISSGALTSTSAAKPATGTTRSALTAANAEPPQITPEAASARRTKKPAIGSFTASPTSIAPGSSSTLSWSTTRAVKVAVTPGTFTSSSVSGSTTVSPTNTTTYTLTATNTAGSAVATVTVTVTPASKPVVTTFTANPTSVVKGASTVLSWSTSGATKVAITPGTFTSSSASGSTTIIPTANTTYALTATNAAGSTVVSVVVTVTAASKPLINSFTASPTSITSGSSSTLSWAVFGATSLSINPGGFTSVASSGTITVSPTASTTYTLTATNATGTTTAAAQVAVAASGGTLKIATTTCPAGTQGAAYAGCTIAASGGTPPYTYSASTSATYPSLPEGMSLDATTGKITSALIGGQGTYKPQLIVTDSSGTQATLVIPFAINGNNAFLASIFPADSIFHHRVDEATTSLPVDNSPAAAMYSGYLPGSIRPFFGTSSSGFPNGVPAIEVPYNQAMVAVSTTKYQSYFTSGPIPSYAPVEGTKNSTGDRHVLVYLGAGGGNNPALYEMWGGIYEAGPWTDSSNALWSNASSDALTPQGNGTSDAAGLPVAPLLVNADEVIGAGTPTAPSGAVEHPIRFTLNHMLNYWVWPATQSAGVGSCTSSAGKAIPVESEISQSAPPASCSMTGAAGEIYRLKASVATPACASTSPQAAIIITGFRNYGIILADNGLSGGLIGTPDARWNDSDLSCLTKLILGDFEPVNVSGLTVSNGSGATSR